MSRRISFVVSALVNAAWATLVQVFAVVLLDPYNYGQFSTAYILYAIVNVLVLSIVSDAWARANSRGEEPSTWADYSSVLLLLLTVSSLFIAPVLLLMNLGSVVPPLIVAIFASGYRVGARYYAISLGTTRYLVIPDTAAIVTMVSVFLVLRPHVDDFASICCSWAAGSLIGALASRTPVPAFRRLARRWSARHSRDIRLLLFDSVAVEGAGIGVPLVLAGIMGPSRFGVYRAISSTGIPVRLILNPLRPVLTRKPRRFFTRLKVLVLVIMLGCSLGVVVLTVLSAVSFWQLMPTSTLYEMSTYATYASLFVAANFVSSFYYVSNRTHLSARAVVILRLVQSFASVTGPLVGYAFGTLDGAIIGFVACSIFNALFSVVAAVGGPGNGRRRAVRVR